ncbi:PepSY-associated TM helix domain-containing protein [Nocardia australiensis]|uniref:PepSY-associated TM helix domain-containing protein n=1 Tax=Nocardia australiensis TaxID=2887191 RepID=UPI001D1520E8|nr:PepSY-associated TM helix domain-containing protein [Nocardia australiensis]
MTSLASSEASAVPDDEPTRSPAGRDPKSPPRAARRRNRRPIRRATIVVHRWSALVLGSLLVLQCTSGAILLYHGELFRMSHRSFYQQTASTPVVTTEQAVDIVRAADPDFDIGWVGSDGGVIAVGDRGFSTAYSVDPGTGRVNGEAGLTDGALGWLVNLHDCALGCPRYVGTLSALNEHVPVFGVTWAHLILGTLGLLLVLLAVSGAVVWWPSLKRWRHGFRVRTKKGRFARDRDLHNVIGIVSVPFLLMWGITGAAFEFPAVEQAWLALTGGKTVTAMPEDTFTPRSAASPRAPVSIGDASAIAQQQVQGRLAYLMLPSENADYYRAAMAGRYSPHDNRAFYSGDVYVYINAADGSDVKVVDSSHDRPLANTFYDKVFQPAHFGWMVNGWWRILWLLLGLTPLALAVTGLSTWLTKNRTKRNARRVRTTSAADPVDR